VLNENRSKKVDRSARSFIIIIIIIIIDHISNKACRAA
jgi:hypothetical protein